MKKHDENYMKQNKILKIGVLIFFLGEILEILHVEYSLLLVPLGSLIVFLFILFTLFNKGVD
jgi:hypothetical protein